MGEFAHISAGQDISNYYAITLYQSSIYLKQFVGAAETDSTPVTYSSANHAWWRMRESAGTVYFDTAPSSASNPPVPGDWTNQRTMTAVAGIDLSNAQLAIQCGSVGSDASPTTTYFDGFNTAANSGVAAITRSFGMING